MKLGAANSSHSLEDKLEDGGNTKHHNAISSAYGKQNARKNGNVATANSKMQLKEKMFKWEKLWKSVKLVTGKVYSCETRKKELALGKQNAMLIS